MKKGNNYNKSNKFNMRKLINQKEGVAVHVLETKIAHRLIYFVFKYEFGQFQYYILVNHCDMYLINVFLIDILRK